jgi:hypothetical protein
LLPSAINVRLAIDRTTTIRASLHDIERTLVIAIGLVMVLVFLFLRSVRTTFIPSLAVPLAIGFGEGSELRRPRGLSIIGGFDGEPSADPLYHSGDPPLSRPLSVAGATAVVKPLSAPARRSISRIRRVILFWALLS